MTLSAATKRERQFQRAKSRPATVFKGIRSFNVHSYEARSAMLAECAYEAVQAHFSHLTIDDVREPPRSMFDAKLARQIAISIMAGELNVERREIARMQRRQRTHIHFAIQAVRRRMKCNTFALAYQAMADHAAAICEDRLETATP